MRINNIEGIVGKLFIDQYLVQWKEKILPFVPHVHDDQMHVHILVGDMSKKFIINSDTYDGEGLPKPLPPPPRATYRIRLKI